MRKNIPTQQYCCQVFITFPLDDDLLHGGQYNDRISTHTPVCIRIRTHIFLGSGMDKYVDFLLGKVFVRSVHHMLEHSFIIKTFTQEYFTLQAVKQDIIRSLASRLELHWDSLLEEEQGSPEGMLLHVYNSNLHQYIPKTQGV